MTAEDALKALRIAVRILTPTASDKAHGEVAPIVNGKPIPDDDIGVGDAVVILRKSVELLSLVRRSPRFAHKGEKLKRKMKQGEDIYRRWSARQIE